MLRRFGAPCLIWLSGCADIIGLGDYTVQGTGGGTSASTSSTASSGGTTTTGLGGQGGGPCVPQDESCNGLDDDCDGLTDEPLSGLGEGCGGCVWTIFDDHHYVLCPIGIGACPGGTRRVVLQSLAEWDFVSQQLPTDEAALIGLEQADGIDLDAGWSWDRTGMPIPWDALQPDDWGTPNFIEDGTENCGVVLASAADVDGVHDATCEAFVSYLACEEIFDECLPGEPCMLPGGCPGVWDCSIPGGACEPVPVAEVCNGLDDNCSGVADDEDACECTESSQGGVTYRFCTFPTSVADMHCGEGFVPAMPKTPAELAEIKALTAGYSPFVRIGVYQSSLATAVDVGWTYHDGGTFVAGLWDSGQPDDSNDVETHTQDCGMVAGPYAGVRDYDCDPELAYVCQSVP